jgi:hypothetical protein
MAPTGAMPVVSPREADHLGGSVGLTDPCFNKGPDALRQEAAASRRSIVGSCYLLETLETLGGTLPADAV